MEMIFLKILNMSYTAAWVILFILIARLLLKRAPKRFSYLLWSVPLVRLLCPFGIESVLSLLPTNPAPIPSNIIYAQTPQIATGIYSINNAVNPILQHAAPTTPYASVNPIQIWLAIGTLIWFVGIAMLLISGIVSLIRLRRKLRVSMPLRDNIWLADHIQTPFVIGFFRPKIYLPASLSERERAYIILHEQTHLKRGDHIVKLFSFLTLCVHWFNPLVWVAFMLSSKDMEMSCDERVMEQTGADIRHDYSASLLTLATGRRIIAGTPLAFGEGNTKGRIKNVLHYKKPAFWISLVAVVAVIALAVGLLTNPRQIDNSSVKQLFEARTEYVGNNSAVGNLLGLLDFPADVTYDHFALQTAVKPYGVEVFFRVSPEAKAAYDTGSLENMMPFRKNACILLALIKNADTVTFTLRDKTEHTAGWKFSRDELESIVGADLWEESKTTARLEQLLTRIDTHLKRAYTTIERFGGVYAFDQSLYLSPLSSQYPVGTTGQLYQIDTNGITIIDEKTGKALESHSGEYTEPTAITADAWNKLFLVGTPVDISGYTKRIQYQLADKYRVYQMDDEIWLGTLAKDGTLWSLYRLIPRMDRTNLDACVSSAILNFNADGRQSGEFQTEAHTTLKTVEQGDTTTVYAMALAVKLGYSDGKISETGGSHMPVAITFFKSKSGEYTMTGYWTPEDGSYYAPSIREKFPDDIEAAALDTQAYLEEQMRACYAQVIGAHNVVPTAAIQSYLDTICSSPDEASNPSAYLKQHPIEYRTLLYYGDYTLQYCFARFEQGGQTGLAGHIMAIACRQILGERDAGKTNAETGQAWYDAFKQSALKLRTENGDDAIQKTHPGAWKLLQMLKK